MTAFYNEHDPFAAQWLRNLITAGHIAPGVVDTRDIRDIEAWELHQYTQCHFFAGIGVWSHALRRAGWDDERPIWTGSCPCQPFSNVGKKKGFGDDRHLWPAWQSLIEQCRPPVVIGEQVASKDGLQWLDLVFTDLERTHYAVGASDLCAAGFQGAHIRQRLYFAGLAHTQHDDRRTNEPGRREDRGAVNVRGGEVVRLADDDDAGLQGWGQRRDGAAELAAGPAGVAGGLADGQCNGQHRSGTAGPGRGCEPSDSSSRDTDAVGTDAPVLGRNAADWLYCRDGKWRPVEPGTFPLVDAAPSRVGRLRAFGNALDAETAAAFCTAIREICDGV